jgi:hypothetical protein
MSAIGMTIYYAHEQELPKVGRQSLRLHNVPRQCLGSRQERQRYQEECTWHQHQVRRHFSCEEEPSEGIVPIVVGFTHPRIYGRR